MASSEQAPIPAPQNDAPWRHRAITSGLSRVLELLKEDSQPMEQIAAAAALNLCKQIRSQLIDRIYTTKVDTQTESQSEKIRSIVPKKHTQSAGVLLNLGQPTSSQLPVSQSAPQLAASRSEPQLQVKSQENAVLPWPSAACTTFRECGTGVASESRAARETVAQLEALWATLATEDSLSK